jgi:hypothetical protein
MFSDELPIITEKFRLTGMQVAALKARCLSTTHVEAARRIGLTIKAFWKRMGRAIAKMDYATRNAVWASFPHRHPKPRVVRTRSLVSNFGDA